jgi:hypothetical protein
VLLNDQAISEYYQLVAMWCYEHSIAVDIAVVGVVLGSCLLLLRRRRRQRRRLRRFLWGTIMSRKDRETRQKMLLEDAIVDATMEAVDRGYMTVQEEQQWFRFYAERLGLQGLLPQRNVKAAIRRRLNWPNKYGLLPVSIPGEKPPQDIKPKKESSLKQSRFRQAAE